jgi:hypothetical protein
MNLATRITVMLILSLALTYGCTADTSGYTLECTPAGQCRPVAQPSCPEGSSLWYRPQTNECGCVPADGGPGVTACVWPAPLTLDDAGPAPTAQ